MFTKQTQDYYSLLEVHKGADAAQIKSKYFELVKKYHPDHNKESNAEEHFKLIVKAYSTLKDPIKRQIYDQDPTNTDQSGSGFSANSVNPEDYYYTSKTKREFYQNRWYNYQKPEYETLHEEFQKKFEEVDQQGFWIMAKRALVILTLYAVWDGYRLYSRRKHGQFLQTQKEIIDANLMQNPVDSYISERQFSNDLGLE